MSTTREAWCVTCNGPVLADDRGCIACHEKRERDRLLRLNAPLHKSCSICGGTYGLHRDQMQSGGPVFTICANCDKPVESSSRSNRYEISPRIRMLQAIRRSDWLTAAELAERMEISFDSQQQYSAFSQNLSRLFRAGFVRSKKGPGCKGLGRGWTLYQITKLGVQLIERETGRRAA